MANYSYGSPSPSPTASPPPPDGHPQHHLQQASMSDLFLRLRRMANDRPADGRSRPHQQQQQQQQQKMYVINMDHVFPPVRKPDGTGWRSVIISSTPHLLDATYPRHHHRATAATPYHRTEHQQGNNRHRRRSPALHDKDEVATKVVCLAKMLSPSDRLGEDGFYQDFLEDITKEARKFGDLLKVVIPRPRSGAATAVAGVGKVFLEYAHLDDAARCRRRLVGRRFSGKKIAATFFSQDRFAAGNYGR